MEMQSANSNFYWFPSYNLLIFYFFQLSH